MDLFCYALFCVHSRFAIILKRKRKLVVLLLLSHRCFVTTYVLWPFLMVPWVGLQYVIVVFPDHTHLLFDCTFRAVMVRAIEGSCCYYICQFNFVKLWFFYLVHV